MFIPLPETVRFKFVKQPWEETTRAVDFTGLAEIQVGETIESGSVQVLLKGVPQPDMLKGPPVISGNRLLFRLGGGVDGSDYDIVVRVITSALHQREVDILMYVRD